MKPCPYNSVHIRVFAFLVFCCMVLQLTGFGATFEMEQVLTGFAQPTNDCKPHTRWWWMGNALRKEDVVWQLDQMQEQGIGGVEQITMGPVYDKGNHEYLSPEYFDLLRFAVEEAAKRGMEFSLNFGGPGWIWGGDWIPKEKQSKVLLASMVLLEGPATFSGPLPEQAALNPDDIPRSMPYIDAADRPIKVVAARLNNGHLESDTAVDLSHLLKDRSITWEVPAGKWQLMAFWIAQRDNSSAVDHVNVDAMKWYCEILGAQYVTAIGEHFGKTVDSLFGDSFEVPIFRNGLYWTDGLFEAFEERMGYDLVPWLPALWWQMDDKSPKVRYDVNCFLHEQSIKAFFKVFLDWCANHGVKGRIQPYGFVTDNIEGAGISHLPEMEITPGEKDAVPWFDTRIGPRTYVASGAHLYGKNIVSTEAFTYLHWQPYRATLEELKTVTDGFLCAGANKFYNHGYIASPERDIVPTRGFFAAIRISHENIWWPYYHHLAEYTARSCWLLRQGKVVNDVAVYSPLANQWAKSVLNARKWTREFDFGCLAQLLMANGYGFDLVNDDILQHHARFDGDRIHLGEMTYRVLILPDIEALPLETYQQVEGYVRGGGRAIALERVPEYATGMKDCDLRDTAVKQISKELFGKPRNDDDNGEKIYGNGKTFCMETVMRRDDLLDLRSAPLDPFLKTLRQCVLPDMDIDLVLAGRRNNEGLTCIHRRTDTMDIYFVANLQEVPFDASVRFRTIVGTPYVWDPHDGMRRPMLDYSQDNDYTKIHLSLAPFDSRVIVFENTDATEQRPPHVVHSDFAEVLTADKSGFTALAEHNGTHTWEFDDGKAIHTGATPVDNMPAAYGVDGIWDITFGDDKETVHWPRLHSWTETEERRHFSGQARYIISFELPEAYFAKDIHLKLSLGVVGNIADIQMNNKPVGVHWHAGQEFDLEGIAQPGTNTLEITVTNTLINRVSGMDAFPEVAEELRPYFGTGADIDLAWANALKGFEPLPRSGLLGPVCIFPKKEIFIKATS